MMLWTSETKSRFIAACGVALIAGWVFHSKAIGPLRQGEAEALREIGELKERLDSARGTIAAIRAQEQDAERTDGLKRMRSEFPAGSPVVWVPPLMKEHFERAGIGAPVATLSTVRDEPGIPGCERGSWHVRLPVDEAARNIATVLLGVADLDRRNPFLRVLDLSIRPDQDNAARRSAVMNVGLLSPKATESR